VRCYEMQHGNTAIHEAAWNGFSRTLQELVFAKSNVNAINNVSFVTVLIINTSTVNK